MSGLEASSTSGAAPAPGQICTEPESRIISATDAVNPAERGRDESRMEGVRGKVVRRASSRANRIVSSFEVP